MAWGKYPCRIVGQFCCQDMIKLDGNLRPVQWNNEIINKINSGVYFNCVCSEAPYQIVICLVCLCAEWFMCCTAPWNNNKDKNYTIFMPLIIHIEWHRCCFLFVLNIVFQRHIDLTQICMCRIGKKVLFTLNVVVCLLLINLLGLNWLLTVIFVNSHS